MRGLKSVLFVSTLFTLAACGGGGGGGSNPPPAPPATNAAPQVNAGSDTTATLPNATVSLTGSATDDGPAASLQYQWSAEPPATGVTFSAATSAATDATFAAAGTYTLKLTVSDGTLSGTDTVVVTVGDAPTPTQVWPADDTDETNLLHGWEQVEAASVGMNPDLLKQASDYAQTVPDTVRDPGSTAKSAGSGMIVRRGQLVHSWGDIDKTREMKSVTKSMGGIMLLLALDENQVALTDKGIDRMPGFGTPPSGNAERAQLITLAQLATHTSGFQKEDGDPTQFTAVIEFEPGTKWHYSDAGLNWLADVLTFRYQQDLRDLGQARVWSVLGLNKNSSGATTSDDVTWRVNFQRPPTRDGGTLQYRELASGISANVNAMARVGLLFLRNGKWKDTVVIKPESITRVKTPLPENRDLEVIPNRLGEKYPNATTDYGVLWWTNTSGTMPNVPKDTFWAWGLGEELIVVIPSLDLVIARNGGQDSASSTGRIWNDNDWDGDVAILEPFLNPIVAATTP